MHVWQTAGTETPRQQAAAGQSTCDSQRKDCLTVVGNKDIDMNQHAVAMASSFTQGRRLPLSAGRAMNPMQMSKARLQGKECSKGMFATQA